MSGAPSPDPHRCAEAGRAGTFHELSEGLRAGGGNGQGELVDCHAVSHRKTVDAAIGDLPGEQLPQQHAIAGRQGCHKVREAGDRAFPSDTAGGATASVPSSNC